VSERLFCQQVYDSLVRICGATDSDSNRSQWEGFWLSEGTEYRFSGWLGFGGKFWRSGDRWYVSCYSEDETPIRKQRIEEANRVLALKRRRWLNDAFGELEASR
jgi:hypothetical protein